MTVENRELELKFELTPEELERFRKKSALRQMTKGRAATKTLHSVYFDTPDHDLYAARIALRVRHIGTKRIQTVKAKGAIVGGLYNPIECEFEVGRDRPVIEEITDPALRRRVRKAIGDKPLEPVCETEMRRTVRMLETETGTLAELALDVGQVRAGERTAELCEVELELKDGDALGLLDLVATLFDDEKLHLSDISKAQRGYLLSAGQVPDHATPLFAETPILNSRMTGDEALTKILTTVAQQIGHNYRVVRVADDPEGAHQLRVGLRRLRSIMRVIRAMCDDPMVESLSNDARDLGAIIGKLRDADVMISDIVEPVRALPATVCSVDGLVGVLTQQREQDRAYVRQCLDEQRWIVFQIRLALFIQGKLWRDMAKPKQRKLLNQPCKLMADDALGKIWRKSARLGVRMADLSVPQRHELRKDLKKVRYLMEFFSGLYPKKKVAGFLKELKQAQEVFGYLNDVATAETLPDICTAHQATSADVMVAVGAVLGWHGAHAEAAWAEAPERWKTLEKAAKPLL